MPAPHRNQYYHSSRQERHLQQKQQQRASKLLQPQEQQDHDGQVSIKRSKKKSTRDTVVVLSRGDAFELIKLNPKSKKLIMLPQAPATKNSTKGSVDKTLTSRHNCSSDCSTSNQSTYSNDSDWSVSTCESESDEESAQQLNRNYRSSATASKQPQIQLTKNKAPVLPPIADEYDASKRRAEARRRRSSDYDPKSKLPNLPVLIQEDDESTVETVILLEDEG